MRAIRWDELPEARQLAGLGKRLSRAAQGRLRWMLLSYLQGHSAARTCQHFGISRQRLVALEPDLLSLRSPEGIIGSDEDGESASHGVFYLETFRARN
jgi:hypothetical protein